MSARLLRRATMVPSMPRKWLQQLIFFLFKLFIPEPYYSIAPRDKKIGSYRVLSSLLRLTMLTAVEFND